MEAVGAATAATAEARVGRVARAARAARAAWKAAAGDTVDGAGRRAEARAEGEAAMIEA